MVYLLHTQSVWLVLVLLSSSGAWGWTVPLPTRTSIGKQPLRRSFHSTKHFALPADDTTSSVNEDEEAAAIRAKKLREFAAQARSEAEQMEINLVNSKLDKLQGLLDRQSKLSGEDAKDIQNRIDQLQRYFDPEPSVTVADASQVESNSNSQQEEEMISLEKEEAPKIRVENLSDEDQAAIKDVEELFSDLTDLFNMTALDSSDAEMMEVLGELDSEFQEIFAGNLTEDDLEEIRFVSNLGKGAKNFIGELLSQSGMTWGDLKGNITKDMKETKELMEKDPLYLERLAQLLGTVPSHILESKKRIDESVVDVFLKQLEDFGVVEDEPKRAGCAYLIPFQSNVDGDTLISNLEERIQQTSVLHGKAKVFYIKDSVAVTQLLEEEDDEVQASMLQNIILPTDEGGPGEDANPLGVLMDVIDGFRKPSILLMPGTVDLQPLSDPESRWAMTSLALGLTASFAAECYSNQDLSLLEQFGTALSSPIFLGIIGIQMLHEFGHFLAAAFYKFEIAFPSVVVPSNFGIMHSNTQFKTPPPNANALFDFAAIGPLFGMSASIASLVYGLILTASTKTSDIAALPHVSMDFLKLSSITSATIESILGTDVLLSLDPLSENVAIHPLVVAGHVGILANALNLLPAARTLDGARMADAVSNFWSNGVRSLTQMFLLIQGFRELDASNFLWVFTFFLLFQPRDIPCKNNVDSASGPFRLPLFVGTTILSLIALSPSL